MLREVLRVSENGLVWLFAEESEDIVRSERREGWK